MDTDNESGNKYAFKLGRCGWGGCVCVCKIFISRLRVSVFEDSDVAYHFIANFAKEQDEWMRLVNMAG